MECQSCPLQPVIDAFVKSDNIAKLRSSKFRKVRAAADAVQNALSSVCLACAHSANDDNPSNHGRSFVSLDSDSSRRNAAASSPGASAHTADFLISQRRPDVHAQDPDGCSSLPTNIEETLKKQFANFAALSPIDLCLVAHLMGGGTFASFATMAWLPHLPYDPLTLQPIPVSRQAVYTRFRNIVTKVPVLAVIAKDLSADPSDTKTRARRFSAVSAIGRANSRLAATRANPVISAPAMKRTSQRDSQRTPPRRPAPSANTFRQLELF